MTAAEIAAALDPSRVDVPEKRHPAATAIADGAGIRARTALDTRLRRQQQCKLIWRLRARVLFEQNDALDRHHCLEGLDERPARYAAIDPGMQRAPPDLTFLLCYGNGTMT